MSHDRLILDTVGHKPQATFWTHLKWYPKFAQTNQNIFFQAFLKITTQNLTFLKISLQTVKIQISAQASQILFHTCPKTHLGTIDIIFIHPWAWFLKVPFETLKKSLLCTLEPQNTNFA